MSRKAWKQEAAACMRYLHGWVSNDDPQDDDEREAACMYEYARESPLLRQAAELCRNAGARRKAGLSKAAWADDVAIQIAPNEASVQWFIQEPWSTLWRFTPEFPGKPWVDLTAKRKAGFLAHFRTTRLVPLKMMNAAKLESLGAFDAFKAMAKRQRDKRDLGNRLTVLQAKDLPGNKTAEDHPWIYALFTLDMGLGKKELLQRFGAWLDLPENKELLEKHSRDARGQTGGFKDRLKDLAVLRLMRQMTFAEMIEYTEKNRLSHNGKPLPFHDARAQLAPLTRLPGVLSRQSTKLPIETAKLYLDPLKAMEAIKRAQSYLAELIPEA